MSPPERNDDEHEPLAPLPAHERTWRHPSEVADHEWRMSEPPLVLGRGLMLTTSVVTGLLVFAVLWTALPTRAGRGAISASQSLVTLGGNSVVDLERPLNAASGGAGGDESDDSAGSGGDGVAALTLPRPTTIARPPADPSPTVQVRHTTIDGASTVPTADAPFVAVAVQGGNLLITTAPAVAAGSEVQIEFADGSTAFAEVILVDQRRGLAVLAPADGTMMSTLSLDVATDVVAGDELTVVGADDVTVIVGSGGAPAVQFDESDEVPEGAPVVNEQGELVALCTHDDDGTARLVTLESLDQIRKAMADTAESSQVWLGLVIDDNPANILSVGAVDPAGPAAAAGLVTGDVILAADGQELTDCDALVTHLSNLQPGDIVRFTVLGSDGATREVAVQLSEPKTAI